MPLGTLWPAPAAGPPLWSPAQCLPWPSQSEAPAYNILAVVYVAEAWLEPRASSLQDKDRVWGKSGGPLGWVCQGSSAWEAREPPGKWTHPDGREAKSYKHVPRTVSQYLRKGSLWVQQGVCYPQPSSQEWMPESCSHPFALKQHLVNSYSESGAGLGIGSTKESKTDPFPTLKNLGGVLKMGKLQCRKWVIFFFFI